MRLIELFSLIERDLVLFRGQRSTFVRNFSLGLIELDRPKLIVSFDSLCILVSQDHTLVHLMALARQVSLDVYLVFKHLKTVELLDLLHIFEVVRVLEHLSRVHLDENVAYHVISQVSKNESPLPSFLHGAARNL